MTHPELEKLLDELGIQSPVNTKRQADDSPKTPVGLLPLVMTVGEFSILESHILSAMWLRFDISPTRAENMSGISLMKFIADQSWPEVPVVIVVGRRTALSNLLAIMVSAKYNGRKVHVVVADSVLESLTRLQRGLFARMVSYADRVVCFSSRESGHLRSGGITADVLYPIVDSTQPLYVNRGAPQPKVVCCVGQDGGELSSLLKAFALVKGKYPRAELTILTDSGEIDCAAIAGVQVKSLDGCIDGLGDSFDININLSSLSGGFLPFMMAQSAGLPTIVTDFGDVREFATHGDNALICRLNDAVSLADAVIALVEHDSRRDQLVQSGALCCNDYSFDSLRGDWTQFLGISF